MKVLPVCCAVLLCMLASQQRCIAQGNTDPDNGVKQELSKPYAISVDALNHAVVFFDPIFVSARITPLSDMDIHSIRIIPQGYLSRMYPAPPNAIADGDDPSAEGFECRLGSRHHLAGRPFVVNCEIAPPARSSWNRMTDPLLFVEPGSQKALLELTLDEGSAKVPYYEVAPIDATPPKFLVMYGGFAGALLLALFSAMRDRIADPIPVFASFTDAATFLKSRSVGWVIGVLMRIWKVVLLAFVGGVCALVLILLAQVTEGAKPPITVKIQDFWGGIVIGLFSVPLSSWISERLKSF